MTTRHIKSPNYWLVLSPEKNWKNKYVQLLANANVTIELTNRDRTIDFNNIIDCLVNIQEMVLKKKQPMYGELVLKTNYNKKRAFYNITLELTKRLRVYFYDHAIYQHF